MSDSNVDRNFLCPRSYVGRAILFLFASPFLIIALGWAYAFISNFIGAMCKLYCYDSIEGLRTEAYVHYSDMVMRYVLGYIRHFIIFIMSSIYIYFDVLITMAIFAFIVWIFLRYTRNGAFGKLEWFRVFASAAGLWFLIPAVSGIVHYSTSDAYPSLWAFLSQNIWSYSYFAIRFVVLALVARKLFISMPYDIEPIWKNEISSREFFSNNLKYVFGKLFRKCTIKYVLIFLALDILIYYFKTT